MNTNLIAFTVIDTKTGQKPDLRKIALEEDWCKNAGLLYCDMDGFLLDQEGILQLVDDCNNMVECPPGRFEVVFTNLVKHDLFVITRSQESARIYLQIRSCTHRDTLEGARKLFAELKATGDPDMDNAKIWQLVIGAAEVE